MTEEKDKTVKFIREHMLDYIIALLEDAYDSHGEGGKDQQCNVTV